jgi:uncharacterized protein (TIGR00730 family)
MSELKTICVFCGASAGADPGYVEAAVSFGQELGRRGMALVYGGGSVGLMGAVARAAQSTGVSVIGVIPEGLTTRELMGHPIGELTVVATMHERKALMASLSDAVVALPGGFGTLDELFEAITWGQIGLHRKPIGLLNVAGYFDPLVAFVDHAVRTGFIRPHHRDLFLVDDDPAKLLDRLADHQPPSGLVSSQGLERV